MSQALCWAQRFKNAWDTIFDIREFRETETLKQPSSEDKEAGTQTGSSGLHSIHPQRGLCLIAGRKEEADWQSGRRHGRCSWQRACHVHR